MLATSEVRMDDLESRGIELQTGSAVIPICTQSSTTFSKPVKSVVHHLAYSNHKPSHSSNMPLVHIHVLRNAKRSPQHLRLLADTVQEVMRSHFQAPPRDRYQIITQHDEGELICEDTELPNLPRSNKLVIIQIFQQGRDKETKQATYAELMKQLGLKCGLGKPASPIEE
jgi:phenylpyruvate tautomerase PptA (4-oxalocrotonate tautomerase family)